MSSLFCFCYPKAQLRIPADGRFQCQGQELANSLKDTAVVSEPAGLQSEHNHSGGVLRSAAQPHRQKGLRKTI